MPQVRPRTFYTAAKHLFRHLNDPVRLKANPIASRFFGKSVDGPVLLGDVRNAVSELRYLILETAKRCRDEGIRAGKIERAQRQYAIIALQYIDGVSIKDIAKRLGISVKHCYRERAEICQRIASYLDRHPRVVPTSRGDEDGFHFLLNRLLECDAYTPKRALDAYDYLFNTATLPHQKIQALGARIALLLSSGNLTAAEADYGRAVRLYDDDLSASSLSDFQMIGQTSLSIAAWCLANHQGKNDRALDAASVAVRSSSRTLCRLPYVEKLWFEARLNYAITLWARGDLSGAYESVNDAASRLDRLPLSSPLRHRVEASVWRLRNYVLLNNGAMYTTQMRLDGLKTAFEQAYASGAFMEAIDALTAIMDCFVFAGREEEACDSGRSALVLSNKLGDSIMQMHVSIDVGQRLLSTKFWPKAIELFPTGTSILQLDDYHRRVLDYAAGAVASRFCDAKKAWRYSGGFDSDNDASRSSWALLTLRNRLVSAATAHSLGLKGAAREAAASAVDDAERLGAASLLRDAYRVAADVLRDRRLDAKALEMARILAA